MNYVTDLTCLPCLLFLLHPVYILSVSMNLCKIGCNLEHLSVSNVYLGGL